MLTSDATSAAGILGALQRLVRTQFTAFIPNEPRSPLSLFFTPDEGKPLSFLTPHLNTGDQVKVVRAPRGVGLLETSPGDDGGTGSPERLCRHFPGR